MKIWSTKNQIMVFQVLSGRANAYLAGKDGRYFLVDTGVSGQWDYLTGALDILGVKKGDLTGLILTHTHFDHAHNAARVKEEYGVPIFVHQSEEQYLGKGDSPLPAGSLVITRWFMEKINAMPVIRFPYEPVSADILVDERMDLCEFGFDAYILPTPGHSRGSLCLVVDNEIAIVGDTMWGGFSKSLFPPVADDPRSLVRSWQKLLETGCSLFLPGHGRERSLSLVKAQLLKFKQIYSLD